MGLTDAQKFIFYCKLESIGDKEDAANENGSEVLLHKSCLEWKISGFNTSGIYNIQSDKAFPFYQVSKE